MVQEVLPDRFIVVPDGRTYGGTNYIGVFVTFPGDNDLRCERVFLAIFLMKDETSQNSREHFEFTTFLLSVLERTVTNVVALVEHNTSTNRASSRTVRITFIGWQSHPIILGVDDLISGNQENVDKEQSIMRKWSNYIPLAMLR